MNATGTPSNQFLEHGLRRHALDRVKDTALMVLAGAFFVAAILAIHFGGQSHRSIVTGAGWVLGSLLAAAGIWILITNLWVPLVAHLRSLAYSKH